MKFFKWLERVLMLIFPSRKSAGRSFHNRELNAYGNRYHKVNWT